MIIDDDLDKMMMMDDKDHEDEDNVMILMIMIRLMTKSFGSLPRFFDTGHEYVMGSKTSFTFPSFYMRTPTLCSFSPQEQRGRRPRLLLQHHVRVMRAYIQVHIIPTSPSPSPSPPSPPQPT